MIEAKRSNVHDWGNVRVTITDATSALIPDARVVLSGPNLPQPFTLVSGADGLAQFPRVPPGFGYGVLVVAPNFRPAELQPFAVELGRVTSLEMRLDIGQVQESVNVSTPDASVDTQSSSSAITLDRSFFDTLAKGRSFYDLVSIAPGARSEVKSTGFEIRGGCESPSKSHSDLNPA